MEIEEEDINKTAIHKLNRTLQLKKDGKRTGFLPGIND